MLQNKLECLSVSNIFIFRVRQSCLPEWALRWRHDTQHNDNQHINHQHINHQHDNIQNIDTQHNDNQHIDHQHDNIHHIDNQLYGHSAWQQHSAYRHSAWTTHRITAIWYYAECQVSLLLCWTLLSVIMLSVIVLFVIVLSVILLSKANEVPTLPRQIWKWEDFFLGQTLAYFVHGV